MVILQGGIVMKTKEVLSSGIDRNFLRKCVKEKVIIPKELDNEDIINKDYIPYDYSQEDVETVWHAYLCRKMGLSYDEIKSLNRGEEIGIKNSMNELIRKYENQIAELEVIIEFMKYVKGFGFIPAPPTELIGSTDFKDYLTDFIEYLDEDKMLKKFLNFAESVTEVENIEEIDSEFLDKGEELYEGVEIRTEVGDAYTSAVLELKKKIHLSPSCDEVQEIINQIFNCYKILNKNGKITAWEFAESHILLLSYESDISAAYAKIFGEETVGFFMSSLGTFLAIHEPDRIEKTYKDKVS